MGKHFIHGLVVGVVILIASSCSTTSNTSSSTKKELSTQPHNIPADWEGAGGLGAIMGGQGR